MLFECVCVFNLLQDIHQFALRQIDVYLSQARAQKNTHHYLLITPYILIQTSGVIFIQFQYRKRDESDAKDAIIDSLKAKCHSLDSQLYAMRGGEEGESARSQNEMTTLPTKTDIVTQFKEKHDIDNIPS